MKAWILDGRFGRDALRMIERPASRPGHGEVLVRVRALSLNYRDIAVIDGNYNSNFALPLIPVSDAAGEVVEVGPGSSLWKVGDRVVTVFQPRREGARLTPEVAADQLGGPRDGGLVEAISIEERGLVRIPESLTFEEAATLPIAAVTAWQTLFGGRPTRAGDVVLVQGTGGVATFTLQLARATGAQVIVTSSSDDKLVRARELGAHAVINYRTNPDWDEAALELTGGVGADLVLDVSGSLTRSVNAARFGGQVAVVGLLGGMRAEVALLPVIVKQVTLRGVDVGSREDLEDVVRALTLHRVRPVIERVFPFERAPDALDALRTGAHIGKIVVRGL